VVHVVDVELRVAQEEQQRVGRASERQAEQPDRARIDPQRRPGARVAQRRREALQQRAHRVAQVGWAQRERRARRAEIGRRQIGRELDGEIAPLVRQRARARAQRGVALADQRAGDRVEIVDGQLVLELGDVLLFVIGPPLVAVAQIAKPLRPVHLELRELLLRQRDAELHRAERRLGVFERSRRGGGGRRGRRRSFALRLAHLAPRHCERQRASQAGDERAGAAGAAKSDHGAHPSRPAVNLHSHLRAVRIFANAC